MTVCVSPNGKAFSQSSSPTNQVLVGTLDGVHSIERSGSSAPWAVARQTLAGTHISSLLFESTRGGLFAGAHSNGLYLSMDGGKTWEPRMNGLTEQHVYALATVQQNGNVVLYAGTQPAYLFRSDDYGESWTELPALRLVPGRENWTFPSAPKQAHVKDMAFDPRDPQTMYLCIEQGCLLKSRDGGNTWQEITGYENRAEDRYFKDCHRITISPTNPDTVYMTGGNGMYRSQDAGKTWDHLTTIHDRVGYPDAFFISTLDENVLFMAGGETDPGTWRNTHTANAAVIRSKDEGRTWDEIGSGLPDYIRASIEAMSMHAWPGGFGFFVGTTDGDLFASEDQGESWTRIAQGLPSVSKAGHYRHFVEPAAAGAR